MKNIVNVVTAKQITNTKVQTIYYPVFAYVTFNISGDSSLFNHFHRYCLYNAYDLLNAIHELEDTCSTDEINQLIIINGEEALLYLSNHQDSDNLIITWKSPEILNVPEYIEKCTTSD